MQIDVLVWVVVQHKLYFHRLDLHYKHVHGHDKTPDFFIFHFYVDANEPE